MIEFRFEFSLPKLVHSIAFFSVSGVPDLTKLKLAKLLYFADKMHLLEHASPILGDVYYCMDYGPVPSFALNEMNEAIVRSEFEGDAGDRSMMDSVLRVHRHHTRYPWFEALHHGYDNSVFSDSEHLVLQKVSSQYGSHSAHELVDLSHREPTWLIPNDGREKGSRAQIPYDLFFEGCDDVGMKSFALLVARFRGEIIPLPGDESYREFARTLVQDSGDFDWSLDSDQRARSGL